MKNSMELRFKPTGHEIETIKQKTHRFMKSCGITDETIDSQFMIMQELIKTGASYGTWPPTETEVIVQVQIDKESIVVEVANPVRHKSLDRLEELDRRIQFFRGYQHPFEAGLVRKNQSTFTIGDPDEFDLFKTAYSGRASLDFFVDEQNILKIWSISKLDRSIYNNGPSI